MTWVIQPGIGSCGLSANTSRGELAWERLYNKGDKVFMVGGSRPTADYVFSIS